MSARGYSAAAITALNGSPEFYQLIKLDFATPLYLTTAPYDLEYDGQTWLSSAIISEIPTIKESLEMRPNNISLQMAGSALVNQALTFENYNNAEVLIYRYLVDTAETVQEYKGFIQTYKKSENKQSGKSVITWTIASHWFDWSRRYGRVINDQEQQDLYTGDRFFEYYNLTDTSINDWAEADPDFGGYIGGVITDIAGAVGNLVTNAVDILDGIFSHGNHDAGKIPKQSVDDRVGNAVNPESKINRLPVMYGEGRVKGIPVFRSLDPANKEFLYVVYALSEGTIDGLTGNKAEFKNGEPYNSTRLSSYCTLVAEYDGTQTTADSTLTSVFGSSGTGSGYLTDAAFSIDDTVITVDTGTGTILVGDIVNFGTDPTNYSVTVALSGGSFTIAGGLKNAVANNTAVTVRSLWTSNHIGNGVAYVVMKYKKAAVWQGEPKPAFVLKGKHLYDPRDGTTAWSANPALVIYDQLTDTLYGKSISANEIDIISFNSVANLAETTNNDHGGEDGGTPVAIDLFSFDGALLTDTPLRDNLEKVLFNCRGHLTHVAGKYKLIAEQTSETSVYSFDEDNIQGNFEVFKTPATSQYNHVLYEIVAPDFDYRPWVEQQKSSTYLSNDNNKPSIKVVKNIYERNRYRAKNRAATIMKKSREGIRVKLTSSNADAMSIECGQIVDITRDSESWTNKLFRVISMEIAKDATCSLSLSEYESTVYDWSVSVEDTPPDDTDLPDPTTVKPPTGLTVASGATHQLTTDDGTTINRLYVSYTASVDEYAEGYNRQYKPSADTNYIQLPDSSDRSDVTFYVSDVKKDQDYDVRIRSFNAQGTTSDWVTSSTNTVDGTETVGFEQQIEGTQHFYSRQIVYDERFDTLDSFTQSGTIGHTNGIVTITVSNTTGTDILYRPWSSYDYTPDYDNNYRFRSVIAKPQFTVWKGELAMGIGVYTSGTPASTKFVGVVIIGDLTAAPSSMRVACVVSDGTSATTSTVTIADNFGYPLKFEVDHNGTDVKFWLSALLDSPQEMRDRSPDVTITTNIPSGTIDNIFYAKGVQSTTVDSIDFKFSDYHFVQDTYT